MFFKSKLVACSTCKHVVERKHAQEVDVSSCYGGDGPKYYCPEHKKPYDKILRWQYYVRQPKWKEVNKDGSDYTKPVPTSMTLLTAKKRRK
jgi:hypothetical protein